MSDRMDVITGRRDEKSDKTYWTRIGVAFRSEKGGWQVKLDALPVSGQMLLVPPRDRDQVQTEPRQRQAESRQRQQTTSDYGRDDDIPF